MYVPRSLLCRLQGVCEVGRGTPGRGGILATSPGVIPGGAGADGSSSKGESSSLTWGRRGGPGGGVGAPGARCHPGGEVSKRAVGMLGPSTAVEEWSWLRRRSPCPPRPAPAQPKGLLARSHPGMVGGVRLG